MQVEVIGYTNAFGLGGKICRNVLCTVNGHDIAITVEMPFTLQKAKAALIAYCQYHKADLGLGEFVEIEPQTFDVPELDAI